MPRIILVRHGRSAHVHTGWTDAAGLHRWMAAYDAAGIAAEDVPPALLQVFAREASVVVCSDLLRARASAEQLVSGRAITVSPLLRETELRIPSRIRCRLPLTGWALAVFFRWIYRRCHGEGTHEVDLLRARQAAEWLEQLATAEGDVLAVTHATFRGILTGALEARGWRCEARWRRYHHWSAWPLVRQTAV